MFKSHLLYGLLRMVQGLQGEPHAGDLHTCLRYTDCTCTVCHGSGITRRVLGDLKV